MTTPARETSPAIPRRSFLGRLLFFAGSATLLGWPRRSQAQADESYLGEIMLWGGTFAPRGWAFCNGQLLPINQNTALFSILGTTYGGDGFTNFALPDLRGRVPIHFGQGPGLSSRTLGSKGGEESHTLLLTELPSHTHVARGSSATGTSAVPTGMFPARSAAHVPQYGSTVDTSLAPAAIASAGGSQPHFNLQPYLTLNYVICLAGVFPSQ